MHSREYVKLCYFIYIQRFCKFINIRRANFLLYAHFPLLKGFRPTVNYSVLLPSCLLVHALSQTAKSSDNKEMLIKTADELYDNGQYEKLFTLLYAERDLENPEILWRLSRAMFEKSRDVLDDAEKLKILEEAFGYVNKALEINSNCSPAHKWCAILMDYVWRYKSTKGRIIHSFDMRKHMEKAIELNPQDSTSYYLLGEWCYTFADLPWYQRRAASLIFASPPTSTYEEALSYFQEAEKIQPHFYSMNFLMIGKCLLKLNNKEKAIIFLEQARNYPQKTPDDAVAKSEAINILKTLGISS